ncbi:MAG: hypothetical protein GKR97_17760 [Rhizobiaceae bacterium]|nr:hypothetical protein [Rhizobiaceae bacterium]
MTALSASGWQANPGSSELAIIAKTLSATCKYLRLVQLVHLVYDADMSPLLSKIARYVVQRAASDPRAREKVAKVALGVAAETKQIASENDRAYAAGKALRRAIQKSQGN